MLIEDIDYTINCEKENYAKLKGSLRLPSPNDYIKPFKVIKEKIQRTEVYSIDVSDLQFLNSSGLTALAKLFLYALQTKTHITIIRNKFIPWQTKSLVSLSKLWKNVKVTFE
jgi:hypothetical protein